MRNWIKYHLAPTILILFSIISCGNNTEPDIIFKSDILEISQISENTFLHKSFLISEKYGKVPCNGIIIYNDGETIVVDTPLSDSSSLELINWIKSELNANVKYVIPSHFHIDCTAGLNAFHQNNIRSLAYTKTLEFCRLNNQLIPQDSFVNSIELKLGSKSLDIKFFGEGHTRDNVVVYFQSEKVLFGGCLIKSEGAGKGNLADANIDAWPETVLTIKQAYPDVIYVIPGHGKSGGPELLDYTIKLFKQN